jgi:hypothetical protein
MSTEEELQAEAKKAEEEKAAEKKHGDWFNSLTKEAQDEITKLRTENAAHRTSQKGADEELEDLRKKNEEYEAEKKKQAEEQGKFKELHETAQKELEAVKPVKKRMKELEASFAAELAIEMKTLPEELASIVNDANVPVEKKLDMARKLKGAKTPPKDSPGNERPGAGNATEAEGKLLEEIKNEKDMEKKAAKLTDLKKKNPALYAKYGG